MARRKSRRYKKRSRRPRFFRSRRGSFYGGRAKRRRSRGGQRNALMARIVGGVGYGAVRGYASNATQNLAARLGLPNVFGRYTDNVVMLALSYMTARGQIPLVNRVPFSRDVGKAGLVGEGILLGTEIANNVGAGGLLGNMGRPQLIMR